MKKRSHIPTPSPFSTLVESLDGISKVAALFEVHERTVKNWLAKGGPRRGPARILCEELLRRHGIAA